MQDLFEDFNTAHKSWRGGGGGGNCLCYNFGLIWNWGVESNIFTVFVALELPTPKLSPGLGIPQNIFVQFLSASNRCEGGE